MPTHRFDGGARLSPDDATQIRFGMMASGRLVRVDLPIAILQAEFGASRLKPLDQFEAHREAIEATAGQAFEARTESADLVSLNAADFQKQASRSYQSGRNV